MDIKGKWVCFEDSLELEIFLNICEENELLWYNITGPRSYLEVDLRLYKERNKETYSNLACGYYTDGVNIHRVYRTKDKLWTHNTIVRDSDRFRLVE
jgi:hypothetical protein